MRRRSALLAVLVAVLVAAVLPGATSSATEPESDSEVFVVHGVLGLDVDVYVNDALTLPGFAPTEVAGPLVLPAGDYSVEIFAAEADPPAEASERTDDPAIAEVVPLPGGVNVSLVAHLDADGTPVLGGFLNDTDATNAGEGRLTARHTAEAPEVNVLVDGVAAFTDVANGEGGSQEVPADTYDVDVQVAPDGPVVLSLEGVEVAAGYDTIAYVVGSAGGTLTAVVQLIEVGELPPPSDVYVVHGVIGLDVDVYVNGALTLPGFAPTEVAGPLVLPAGDYSVEIFAAEADPPAEASERTDDPAIAEDVALPSGVNASLVAHLDADGTAVLGVFLNDTEPTVAGEARATARHTAQAPAVNVLADGAVLFPDVTNGQEGVIDVPAGSYDLGIQVAPDGAVVLDLEGAELATGFNTVVYVVGSATAHPPSLTAIVQPIDVGVLPATFSDVGPTHPFFDEIQWMAVNGIANGFDDGTFRPTTAVTRQAFAAFGARYLSDGATPPACVEAPFSDVPVSHPFCAEISLLATLGIVEGYSDGTFRPATSITRQATAAMLYRMAGFPDGPTPSCSEAPFPDVATSNPFCGEITWMVDAGITTGFSDGTFRPLETSTRQAASAFFFRLDEALSAAVH